MKIFVKILGWSSLLSFISIIVCFIIFISDINYKWLSFTCISIIIFLLSYPTYVIIHISNGKPPLDYDY